MDFIFYLLLLGLLFLFIYYLYNLRTLMKNVQEKYINEKFKIFGLLMIIPKEYFSDIGIKYLSKVRWLAFILFLYTIAIVMIYFSNR